MWLVRWRSGGPFVPCQACPLPPCRCARLETSSTCQSPAEDRFLTRFCRLSTHKARRFPASSANPLQSPLRQRRPRLSSACVLSRNPSHTCAHLLRQHTCLSLFIASASQPAASSQPASPKIPVSVTRRRQDNRPCLNTTHRDGILSDCHRGPAQEAKTLFFGAPVPNRVWRFCPGQGRDDVLQPRDPAPDGQRATALYYPALGNQ